MNPRRRPLPPAPLPTPSPESFGYFPPSSLGLAKLEPWQIAVYEQALAEAQAVVRPSLPERNVLAVWN
jgi:hypothetical protein